MASDILRKLLLRTRPYELTLGDADEVYEQSLNDLCQVLEIDSISHRRRLRMSRDCLTKALSRFRDVPADYSQPRPLIGIVGEIFCRLNRFSNQVKLFDTIFHFIWQCAAVGCYHRFVMCIAGIF